MRFFQLPFCLSLAGITLCSTQVLASETIEQGKQEYTRHCSVCHGEAGQGDGPMRKLLTGEPRNLTLLSHENGGTFPETMIYQIIDGRRLNAFHGSAEMPIWGERYRTSGTSEEEINQRIGSIIRFLESIQEE